MTLDAVPDTGPIIHLAEIDALDLLGLLDDVLVPTAVYRELATGGVPAEFESIEFELVDVEVADRERGALDPGERAALSLAIDRDAVLLTDDLAARQRATEIGVRVHGTIGMIALGVTRDALSKETGIALVRSLQHETSLYVSDAVVARGISLLEDS